MLSKKPYSEKRTVDSSKRVRARHTIQLHDPSIPPSTTVSIDVYCDSPPANSNPPQHSPAPDRRITIMAEPNLDISDLHPVVSFTAGSPISTTDHWSRFEVIVGGAKVHEELTSLVDITGPSGRPSYQTSLIPQHWVQLTQTTGAYSLCSTISQQFTLPHRSQHMQDHSEYCHLSGWRSGGHPERHLHRFLFPEVRLGACRQFT